MTRYNSLNPRYARVDYFVVLEQVSEFDDDVFDRIVIGCFGGYGRAVHQARQMLRLLAAGVGDQQPYEEGLKTSLNSEGYPLWYGDVHSSRESGLGNYMISVFPKM